MKKRTVIVTLFVWYALSLSAESQKTETASGSAPAAASSGTPVLVKVPANKDSTAPPVADIAKTGFARLSIRSQPDSAAIVIDSVERGQTPALFDSLAPGVHTMLIKKKGYFVKKITTTLSPDSLHDISVVLVKPGALAVRSEPSGAALYIDNKESGVTPYDNAKLKPGDYTLRLERTNYETVQRSVTIVESVCDTVSIILPISKAYADSVERVKKEAAREKRKFKKTIDFIVIGAFLVFGAVIFLMEAGNAD